MLSTKTKTKIESNPVLFVQHYEKHKAEETEQVQK
jgi:hypothetical protein